MHNATSRQYSISLYRFGFCFCQIVFTSCLDIGPLYSLSPSRSISFSRSQLFNLALFLDQLRGVKRVAAFKHDWDALIKEQEPNPRTAVSKCNRCLSSNNMHCNIYQANGNTNKLGTCSETVVETPLCTPRSTSIRARKTTNKWIQKVEQTIGK